MNSIENLSGAKKATLLIGVSTGLLILVIATLEILAYIWLQKSMPKHHERMTMAEFILSKPLPFARADDYDEVRREWAGKTNCPRNRIVNDAITGFPRYETPNVSCDGPVTMRDGLRTTIGAVANAKNRVLFFGGSTMWGTGSADRNTIPSIIQRRFVESNLDYGVANHGFASVVISQQVKLLKTIPINKGDIVVFYDGGNDVWNSVVYGNPNGGIIGYNDANLARVLINRIKFFLSSHSYIYDLLGQLKSSGGAAKSPCLAINDQVILSRAAAGFDVYYRSAQEAKRYVEATGGRFFHFLQPSLVSSPPLSRYEKELIAAMAEETRCGIDGFAKGYDIYKRKYSILQEQLLGTDLTDVLDSTKTGNEYFWDYIHVSSVANKVVTDKIFDVLTRKAVP